MASRGPRLVLFLTLGLLAVGLAQTANPPDSYPIFVRDHVDFPKTRPPQGQSYCNYMMNRLNERLRLCKIKHTFIHRSANWLQPICTTKGKCNQNNQCDSKAAYRLTTCQVRRRPRPPCVYRGISQTRRIRLGCEQRRPVRFLSVL